MRTAVLLDWMLGAALLLTLALAISGCTSAQVAQTQATVNTGCALAPTLDKGASQTVQTDVATGCAVEQTVAPVVAPLVTKPAN
jgi:hypothetical protein